MDKKDRKNVCVYFLRDPRDFVARYVGITSNPRNRMNLHRNRGFGSAGRFDHSKPGTAERYYWLQELKQLGMCPVMDVVFTGLTERQARSVEAYLLEKHFGNFYQANSGRIDNVSAFNRLWSKCQDRERQIIMRIMNQSMVAS